MPTGQMAILKMTVLRSLASTAMLNVLPAKTGVAHAANLLSTLTSFESSDE